MKSLFFMRIEKSGGPKRQNGFSIIELMISITLGLLVIAGMTAVFVNSSQTRADIERNNRQIESGRYAVSILSDDLRMAGFFGSFDPYHHVIKPGNPPLGGATPMVAMPDPCNTTVSGNASSWMNSFFVHVQGIDNAATIPSCLTDIKADTDILVVRRLSSCVAGPVVAAGCDAVITGVPYFQASNCYLPGELATNTGATSATDYLAHFALSTTSSSLTKRAINCTTLADYRRYIVRIYFVANNNVGTDGVPTLKRAELGTGVFTIVPLVEGIETVQFEYGMDTDNDGRVDVFNANPSTFNGCVGAGCVANWLTTYVVKINVLARNTETTPGFTDSKTYILGKLANGTTDNSYGPYGDGYKRHVFNSVVRLDNPAGRKLP